MREPFTAPAPIGIAVVGAPGTGKTALAATLAPRLAQLSGLRTTWVPDALGAWCQRVGRLPLAHEQAPLLRAWHERVAAAAERHDIVVCDGSALDIAVDSALRCADRSLDTRALALHRRIALTLLLALDLPAPAGDPARAAIDGALRERLLGHGLPWSLVAGTGAARLEAAVDAVAPLLRAAAPRSSGLFTRLAGRNAEAAARAWRCENCDDAGCEHRLLRNDGVRS